MDHRTIVSFFTCQLVWVNRYISRAYAQRQQSDVHAGGGGAECDRVLAAECVAELLFQFMILRARGDPARFQYVTDSTYLGITDGGPRKWQKILHKRSNEEY